MKVLLFLPDISRRGGVERVVANLANLVSNWAGYEVTILSCFNTNTDPAYTINQDVKTECLNSEPYPLNLIRRIIWYNRLSHLLTVYLQRSTYDVVLAEGSYLCTTLSLVNNKHVLKVGCEHISYRSVNVIQKCLRRFLYLRLDRLVVLTENDRRCFSSFLTQVDHIPNFVENDTSAKKSSLSNKIIISAGRLTHQKGFDTLLKAFTLVVKMHPDWHLVLFGEGEERVRLERLAENLKITKNISLPGETKTLLDEFDKASIFAMPSRYEGLPMTLIEAMSAGLACVSFSCSGPDEIIDHRLNGLLIPQGDIKELAKGIIQLIENNQQREELAANALIKAGQFSRNAIEMKWKEWFGSINLNRYHK